MPDVSIQHGKLDEDSDAIDLVLDQTVAGPTPLYFDDPAEAGPYPVAQKLLALDAVSALLLQDQKITICRSNTAGEWNPILESIRENVERHYAELPEPE
ncbi:MAG: NifU N-terminal domain-containing protein, partial [Planctomycetota bacterium]